MNKKRIIKLKTPRLRRARTELRTLLRLAFQRRVFKLYDKIEAIEQNSKLALKAKEYQEKHIQEEIKALKYSYNHSALKCRVCGHQDLDLIHNPIDDLRYCGICYEFNQSYYRQHPEEADWRESYP